MSKQQLLELADFIESGTHPWSIQDCETCFIGQAEAMTGVYRAIVDIADGIGVAGAYAKLIMPPGWDFDPPFNPTRSQAVATLREFAETGKINWEAKGQEEKANA